MGAHLALDLQRGRHVLRVGHAVGNDGGFERHDGTAGGPSRADLGGDIQRRGAEGVGWRINHS